MTWPTAGSHTITWTLWRTEDLVSKDGSIVRDNVVSPTFALLPGTA